MDTSKEFPSLRNERYLLVAFFVLPALVSGYLFWGAGALQGKYLLFSSFLAFSGLLSFTLSLGRVRTDPRGRWLYRYVPAICFMAAIYWASSFSFARVKRLYIPPDYLMHTMEYAVFGYLGLRMLNPHRSQYRPLSPLLPFLLCLLYGASDEFHQYFVPGRDASLRDLACDALGIALGMLAFLKLTENAKGERATAKGPQETRPTG